MSLYKSSIYLPVFTPGRNSWFYRLEESWRKEGNTSLHRPWLAQTHSVCQTPRHIQKMFYFSQY